MSIVHQILLSSPPQSTLTHPQLNTVATHQSNHARLVRLRQTSTALSEQITQVLTVLANTRAEVLSTPSSNTFPQKDSRDVPYDDLLSYAKKISKFTVPPTTTAAPHRQQSQQQHTSSSSSSSSSPRDDGQQDEQPRDAGEEKSVAVAGLSAEQRSGPTVRHAAAWIPWPADDTIRRGALARIQGMLDAGEDPGMVAGEERAESGREQRQVQGGQEEERQSEPSRPVERDVTRRSEPIRVEEKPAVFGGLDLYDPDED